MQSFASSRGLVIAVLAFIAGACGDLIGDLRARIDGLASDAGEATAQHVPATLVLDLMPGIEVSIDGNVVGRTPLAPIPVSPGGHQVKLNHRCAMNPPTLSLDLESGETRTVTAADSGLPAPATLRLTISALHGETLAPMVWLGMRDVEVTASEIEHELIDGRISVFPCPQRLRIKSGHPTVGGYLEDIPFVAGGSVARDVVLAPGPDMVRLPGDDHFLAGMRPEDEALLEEDDEIDPRHEVKIAPFELDRSPVTAAQWSECRAAGGCKDGVFDSANAPDDYSGCAIDPFRGRAMREGAGQKPMNCVARYEAERYCAWAGKRLPTIEEYEYAARGGRSDTKCPWGGGTELPLCSRRPEASASFGQYDVCGYSRDNSRQGVCDLVWMHELVADTRLRGAGRCDDFTDRCPSSFCEGPVVGGGGAPWTRAVCHSHTSQFVAVTFRCARTVKLP
jgi:formylglycine-generating enzyme required for sulfatase activity